MKKPALDGIRVLDLTRILSGPYCTQILADHGADVIKVERPGSGDDTRRFGPPFVGEDAAYFLSINRNKQSVCVDLKNPEGAALVRELAARSDVVVQNFRPGAAERLGLGAEDLHAINPKLVYCSISGFGQTGPWSSKPGYDLAVQGLSGVMSITGTSDGPPTKVGTSIADIVTGMYAAQGILLALYRRSVTGVGDTVDIAMLDSMVSLLTYQAGNYFATGTPPARAGNRHPNIVPYETFQAEDGWFNLAVGNDKLWARFCEATGRDDLAADVRFTTNPDRVAHREELFSQLSELFADRPVTYWVELLETAGIPCGPILDVSQVLTHPQVLAREMVTEADGQPLTGTPVKLEAAPAVAPRHPPKLGQHTASVLAEVLGYDDARVASLAAAGVIDTAQSTK
jgi:crotonobetainyl-CoA:carnitine CoA-transferase CaiB-like acyl-CoA transferase